jgi:hypothetical protein
MGTAMLFVVGVTTNGLANYKNLRITPAHKHQIIQDWGHEHKDSVAKVLASRTVAFHAKSFQDLQKEGMGIDHEEWKKGKEAYKNGN